MFILYHECTNGTMPSTLLVLRTIPPTLRTFPPNRPKWVHFCRALPHSAKESPFPGIRKAGRGRTLSGQMTPFLHFISLKGKSLSLSPYILTSYQSKHSKRTTQASYQNLGGYMASYGNSDTRDGCTRRCKSRCIASLFTPLFSPQLCIPSPRMQCRTSRFPSRDTDAAPPCSPVPRSASSPFRRQSPASFRP